MCRAPQDGDRRDRALFVAIGRRVQLRAAAVLPGIQPPELLVDLRLPEGSSFAATEVVVKRFERSSSRRPGIENYVSYVGQGSPRFYLPLDQQLANANFAQFVILTKGIKEREAPPHPADRALRPRLPGSAREHHAARERPAGRVPGAVPGVGRGHPHGAATRRARRGDDAREPASFERAVRLGREGESDQGRDRPGEAAPARAVVAGAVDVPEHLAERLGGHPLSRAGQADRSAAARRGRRTREAFAPAGPGGADAFGQIRSARADRQHLATRSKTASSGGATGCRRSRCGRTSTATSRRRW